MPTSRLHTQPPVHMPIRIPRNVDQDEMNDEEYSPTILRVSDTPLSHPDNPNAASLASATIANGIMDCSRI